MPTSAIGRADALPAGPSLAGVAVRRALRGRPRRETVAAPARPLEDEAVTVLLFLGEGGEAAGWAPMEEDTCEIRPLGELAPERLAGADVVAVAPGEQVGVLRLALPGSLSEAQALAAARLMVAELAAEPVSELHIALAEAEEDGTRLAAYVSLRRLLEWQEALGRLGAAPRLMVPAPLLHRAPEEGLSCFMLGSTLLVRGRDEAFALEPELAQHVIGERPATYLPQAAFSAGLAEALSQPPLDLLQGRFRRSGREASGPSLRKLAILAAAVAVLGVAGEVASVIRYAMTASALERRAEARAAQVLPGSAAAADPAAELRQHLTGLADGPGGFSPLAAALFGAVRDSGGVELAELRYASGSGLGAVVRGNSAADLDGLRTRLESQGYSVDETPGARDAGLIRRSIRIAPR